MAAAWVSTALPTCCRKRSALDITPPIKGIPASPLAAAPGAPFEGFTAAACCFETAGLLGAATFLTVLAELATAACFGVWEEVAGCCALRGFKEAAVARMLCTCETSAWPTAARKAPAVETIPLPAEATDDFAAPAALLMAEAALFVIPGPSVLVLGAVLEETTGWRSAGRGASTAACFVAGVATGTAGGLGAATGFLTLACFAAAVVAVGTAITAFAAAAFGGATGEAMLAAAGGW